MMNICMGIIARDYVYHVLFQLFKKKKCFMRDLCIFDTSLTLKGRGYFTNERTGGGHYGPPPRLSRPVVMGRGGFQGTDIF